MLAPPADAPGAVPIGLAVVLGLLFLARLAGWMTSDVWFDEALTINDHVARRTLGEVVGSYPAANHHVLFSVILWLWVRTIEPYLAEWLMRVPCALFGATMVVLPLLHWRRWLGRRAAVACSITLGCSLVVAGFAWQLRGYSLSMLLGALATGGVMELIDGSRRRGMILCLPAALMLPLVIPTNVLLLAALGVFLILARPRDVAWRAWTLRTLLPIAAAGALGCAYYLTVWADVRAVVAHSEGWPSAIAVVRAWAIAAVAHFGPVLLPFAWQHRQLVAPRATAPPDRSRLATADLALAWKMLVPLMLFPALLIMFLRPAPFPRTFLVCLPTATFAVFFACRSSTVWTRISPTIVAGIIVLHGAVWQVATDRATAGALRRGQHPQDLVMEYYRGRLDVSEVTDAVVQTGLSDRLVLLADFHDFPTTQFYWGREHLDVSHVIPAWGERSRNWRTHVERGATLAVQAFSEAHADQLLRDAGLAHAGGPTPRLTPLVRTSRLTIWTIDLPGATTGATTSTAPIP